MNFEAIGKITFTFFCLYGMYNIGAWVYNQVKRKDKNKYF